MPLSNQHHKKILSPREKQCAHYLLNGMTAKEIGQQLGLSSRTVESYIVNMKIKLNCANKAELIACALRMQLSDPGVGDGAT